MSKHIPIGLTLGALLGSAAFFIPAGGFAQNAPAAAPPLAAVSAPKPDEGGEKARADTKAFLEAKLAALHAGLQLTAAQAPLWGPVESAIRNLAALHGKWHEAKESGGAAPLDRLKRRSEWLVQSGQALKTLTDATGPLTASLDAAQKDRLPKLLEGSFKGRKMLYAAFDVSGGGREGGSQDGHHDGEMRDGSPHGPWHHGHGGEGEEHPWHHHHHHHWHHHHWDHEGGGQDQGEDRPWHRESHGDGEGHGWDHRHQPMDDQK